MLGNVNALGNIGRKGVANRRICWPWPLPLARKPGLLNLGFSTAMVRGRRRAARAPGQSTEYEAGGAKRPSHEARSTRRAVQTLGYEVRSTRCAMGSSPGYEVQAAKWLGTKCAVRCRERTVIKNRGSLPCSVLRTRSLRPTPPTSVLCRWNASVGDSPGAVSSRLLAYVRRYRLARSSSRYHRQPRQPRQPPQHPQSQQVGTWTCFGTMWQTWTQTSRSTWCGTMTVQFSVRSSQTCR